MSFFLWYRNQNYDRALAVFIFTLGLIQLIEYGIHSGTDPSQSGRTLFIVLWLQCLVLAIGVFVFINDMRDREFNTDNARSNIAPYATTTQNIAHTIAGWNLFLFGIIFVIGLILTFLPQNNFHAGLNQEGHVEWYMNDESILSQWGWLYAIGIFVPLFLIFSYYMWADAGIAILIIYGALAVAYVLSHYPVTSAGSMWSYLSVGFAFLAWYLGLLPISSPEPIKQHDLPLDHNVENIIPELNQILSDQIVTMPNADKDIFSNRL
jgi:hypothetical protein